MPLIPLLYLAGAGATLGGVAYGTYTAAEKATRIALWGGAFYLFYVKVIK